MFDIHQRPPGAILKGVSAIQESLIWQFSDKTNLMPVKVKSACFRMCSQDNQTVLKT